MIGYYSRSAGGIGLSGPTPVGDTTATTIARLGPSAERPVAVDFFCGAGGVSAGLKRAGFYTIGYDIKDQPRYAGDEFHKLDVRELFVLAGRPKADVVVGSPPCQVFTRAKHLRKAQGGETQAIDLVDVTRRAFRRWGLPYVIENVPGAPLYGVQLCGSMFGLAVQRHRIFESNVYIPQPKCDHSKFPIDPKSGKPRPVGVYHVLNDEVPKGGRTAKTLEEAREAMGIGWMEWDELKEAIPPAYTEYVGRYLMAAVEMERAA